MLLSHTKKLQHFPLRLLALHDYFTILPIGFPIFFQQLMPASDES